MNPTPHPMPPSPAVPSEDESHLSALATGHTVLGIVLMVMGCIPLLHVVMGLAVLFGVAPHGPAQDAFAAALIGGFFILIGGILFLFSQALGVTVLISGRFLRNRRHHSFSFVLACVLCAFPPLGTILGVFTLIVLSRPAVRRLYHLPVN